MRELWQQTGMKTNGRKLLVDSLSEEDENNTESTKNRKYPKRLKRQGQCRVHPKLTSSSSGSSARYGFFAPLRVLAKVPEYQICTIFSQIESIDGRAKCFYYKKYFM